MPGLARALCPAALTALAGWAVQAAVSAPALRVALLTLAGTAGLAFLLLSGTGREYLRLVKAGPEAPGAGR